LLPLTLTVVLFLRYSTLVGTVPKPCDNVHHANNTVHAVLFITSRCIVHTVQYPPSRGTVYPTASSLPRVVTMLDNTETAALFARLEAIIKEAEDAEVQAAAARRHVQAASLLLEEEVSKAADLEQTTTSAC
jgi:hypothetical protein